MARPNVMTSMELDDDAVADMPTPIDIPMSQRATFPYGLRICLTDKELEKMGIDVSDAKIGGMMHMHAMGRVTSVSSEAREGGKSERLEIQIEDLCIECEDDEG